MKHPHAANMLLYAEDAAETDKPWERWEAKESVFNTHPWRSLFGSPLWEEKCQYRRKPKPYTPTLLDEALELEIKAAETRCKHWLIVGNKQNEETWARSFECLITCRSPEYKAWLEQQRGA